jgi:hypothetical protein
MLSALRSLTRRHWQRADKLRIYRQFERFTMIPANVYADNLELAVRVDRLAGCIVECGVWRGGMCAGIAALLGPSRRYYLFDSFEGLPDAQEIDGEAALNWQKQRESPYYYDNCSAKEEFAREAMKISGATDFRLVRGWFNDTIRGFVADEPIALLRLDGDWYDSTIVCLEGLFDQVVPGGLIILDDYYAWDGCCRALHDFLSQRSAVERIRSHGEVCYLQKAAN